MPSLETPTSRSVRVQSLVAGSFEDGEGDAFEIRNPARPAEVVAAGRGVSEQQVRRAIAAAAEAFAEWRRTPVAVRGGVLQAAAGALEERASDLAELITREEGKTLGDSTVEVQRAISTLRFYGAVAGLVGGQTLPGGGPDTLLLTKREPLGVIALITPWNFPLAIPTQKLAPALVAGNAVVLKPSSYTPAIAGALAEALVAGGAPAGTVSLVVGPGGSVGQQLAEAPEVGAVSFTGSGDAGRRIAEVVHRRGGRIQLELGGKNPMLVAADADLELAADVTARGAFGLTGQSCTATGRIFVDARVHARFVGALVRQAQAFVVGDGLDPGVSIGPKVAAAEAEGASTRVDAALDRGDAVLVHRSKLSSELVRDGGHFLAPVVLDRVRPRSEVGSAELFSPVACVTPVASFEEGIRACNTSRYALAASVCTSSLATAHRFVDEIEAGIVKVNAPTTGLEIEMPFGGFKESADGVHKELGLAAIDFYTRLKSVYLNYPAQPGGEG